MNHIASAAPDGRGRGARRHGHRAARAQRAEVDADDAVARLQPFEHLDQADRAAGAFDWLTVTSATTVDVLFAYRAVIPAHTKVAAVGETTAAALQAVAALTLAFVPDVGVAFFAAGLLGLGYGCFLSVDQALATQVLPDPHTRGKDLGIMNIATAVPQAVAPFFGALIVAALVGFPGLFVLSAIAATLGALAVLPIRSVK